MDLPKRKRKTYELYDLYFILDLFWKNEAALFLPFHVTQLMSNSTAVPNEISTTEVNQDPISKVSTQIMIVSEILLLSNIA